MALASELWSIQMQRRFYNEHEVKLSTPAFKHATEQENLEKSIGNAKQEQSSISANVEVDANNSVNTSINDKTTDDTNGDENLLLHEIPSVYSEDNEEVNWNDDDSEELKSERRINKSLSKYKNALEDIDKLLESMEEIAKTNSSLVENENQQKELRQLQEQLENTEFAIPYHLENKRNSMLWRWPTESWSVIKLIAKYLWKRKNLYKAQWMASLTLVAAILIGAFSAVVYCIYWLTSSSVYLTAKKEPFYTMFKRRVTSCDYAIITNRWTKSERRVEIVELPTQIVNTENDNVIEADNDKNKSTSTTVNNVIEDSKAKEENSRSFVNLKTVNSDTFGNNEITQDSDSTTVKWKLRIENKRHANDVTFIEEQDCNKDYVKLRVNWLLYKTQMYCHKNTVTDVIDLSPVLAPFRFERKRQIDSKHSLTNDENNETLQSSKNNSLTTEKNQHFNLSHFLLRARLLFDNYDHQRTSHYNDKNAIAFASTDNNNDARLEQQEKHCTLPKVLIAECVIRPLRQGLNSESVNRGIVELAIQRVVNESIEQRYYNALANKSLQQHKRLVYAEAMIANGTINGEILSLKDIVPDLSLFEQDVLFAVQQAVKDVAIIYSFKLRWQS